MSNRTTIWLFVSLVFVLPAVIYLTTDWWGEQMEKLPVLGPAIDNAGKQATHTISDFRLTNQDGNIKSTSDWKGRIVIADFFFTHCPAICPKMTKNLKKVQESYRNDERLLFNSFTVDPERDSAAVLKAYTARFGLDTRNWSLLTGDKKDLYKLARNSFMIVATDGDGGPDDFIHSEKLVLIDRQKQIRGYYTGTDDAEIQRLIRDIQKLKNEN